MGFAKQVLAYLTGWAIAQTFYNRVIRHFRDTEWVDEKVDIAARAAAVTADEFERRYGEPSGRYPRVEGDTVVIGPEVFAQGGLICWRGENYVPQAAAARGGADRLVKVAQTLRDADGGCAMLRYDDRHPDIPWSVMMVFGREAPDSPMAGGVANGMGESLAEAVDQALKDLG